jgi:hypothetical protein
MGEKYTVNKNIASKLEDIGRSSPPSFDRLIPIMNSRMSGTAGSDGDIGQKYVGHVSYSPDFNSIVYQVEKEQYHLLHSVEGQGFSISRHIVDELEETYKTDYVFGGMRESNNILVFPLDAFSNNWQSEMYDEQLYARLDRDVLYKIPDEMSNTFSEIPSVSENSISLQHALSLQNAD